MRHYKKLILRFVGGLLFLCIFASLTLTVKADDSYSNAADGSQISPTRYDFNASRGDTKILKLNITNVTASDLIYTSSVSDFSAKDESGSPKISIDDSLPATSSIRSWISVSSTFKLGSHQSIQLDATVTIPDNAEPGGHYGVISFSGSAPEVSGSAVGLSASTGVLVLITVDGDIKENASMAEFFSSQDGKQSWFFENGPVTFVTRVKNDGNVHIKPTGTIELRDMFGGLTATMNVNKADSQEKISNVLPNSIRRFESTYDKKWMFGRYTANLALSYGSKGQAIVNTISFWVIPYKLIIAGLFILITIIFILTRIIKVYNKRIIERHEKAHKNKHDQEKNGS